MIGEIGKYLAEGFALGLTLGTTCAATCGPMYLPYLMQRQQTALKSVINIFEISAGRFVSYVGFGIVAGSIGHAVGVILERDWFSSAAYILFSIMLLISAFRTHKKEKGCSVSKWSKFSDRPFLFGVLTGVSMCPSFFGAMTAAFDTGGPVGGGSIFAGFFFGSSIFLLPFAIAGLAGNVRIMRKIAVVASVGVAAYFIGKGTVGFVHLYQKSSGTATTQISSDVQVVNAFDSIPLFVIGDSTVAESLVKAITPLKKGPVTVATAKDSFPENCHILVQPGRGVDAKSLLKPGRFIVVIPDPAGDSTITPAEYSRTTASYLGEYLFKCDEKNGTFFDMSAFLKNMKAAQSESGGKK